MTTVACVVAVGVLVYIVRPALGAGVMIVSAVAVLCAPVMILEIWQCIQTLTFKPGGNDPWTT